ncbi:hypothetical protein I4U23_002977 [Adineta vaga]|nr:hypothetical protein I4U23_002977 [Adineta vaga]
MVQSEQAEYDLRNNLRKTKDFVDIDDDYYNEDDDIEYVHQVTTTLLTITTLSTTLSQIRSESIKSSASHFLTRCIYLLLLLLLILTQTNK